MEHITFFSRSFDFRRPKQDDFITRHNCTLAEIDRLKGNMNTYVPYFLSRSLYSYHIRHDSLSLRYVVCFYHYLLISLDYRIIIVLTFTAIKSIAQIKRKHTMLLIMYWCHHY